MSERISTNIAVVRDRIVAACRRAGRDPGDVTLIAVTKTRTVEEIAAAYDAGIRDFGENRVQEGFAKIPALRERCPDATWHLIGHLQRNKAGTASGLFAVIHSIDSEKTARAVSERASGTVRAFVEVNVSGEASKHGVTPEDAPALATAVARMANIDLRGLMTVAPIASDPEDVRPVFRRLRELGEVIGLTELSMGMTDDFEVAIEEGATAVRVGRAIFGPRA